MSLGPLYVFLGEVSVQVLCPFFNWVVCLPGWNHVSSLYILDNRHSSEVSLTNMFSHTFGFLSLAMQKLFILMRFLLFIISFMSLALGDESVRMLLHGMSEIFLPIFPLGLLWCYDLYLSLLSTLSLFLCMASVGDLVSFFSK